jgi:hypothetical protein
VAAPLHPDPWVYRGRLGVYIWRMPRKPTELPPAIARRSVEDMGAYFSEKNLVKRDEIAGRQMHVLRQYQGPREKPVRIPDIMEMFRRMRDDP